MKTILITLMLILVFPITPPTTLSLIERIIIVESNFNPKAISKKGAIGLMQIRYSVWKKELKKQNIIQTRKCLFNPEKNLKAGKYILDKYLRECKNDLFCTLKRYSGNAKNYHKKVITCVSVKESSN